MFGWNALALALKGQNIYSGGCDTEPKGMQCLPLLALSLFLDTRLIKSPPCLCSSRSLYMLLVHCHDVCAVANGGLCPTQESKLAVLWTVGIFALNFGPVFVGPVLDWVGPKLTTVLGKLVANPDSQDCLLHVRHSATVCSACPRPDATNKSAWKAMTLACT